MQLPLKDRQKNISGQALLLVVLGMAVVLTVALSIVARSTTDIGITTKDEEYTRAFSAAEAGIEKVLLIGQEASDDLANQSSYSAKVTDLGSGANYYNVPGDGFYSGEVATIWFVSHDDNNNLVCDEANGKPCFTGSSMKVCWGSKDTPDNEDFTPAIEAVIYYDPDSDFDFSNIKVKRVAIDPNSSRRGQNNFGPDSNPPSDCQIDTQVYEFKTHDSSDFNFSSMGICNNPGCLLMARIKFLYNTTDPHPVGVQVQGDSLPSQGKLIESTGTSVSSKAKVDVGQTYKNPLPIFENAVFSPGGDLVK